jgi:Cupin domain
MKIRQLITGHDSLGNSVFLHEYDCKPTEAQFMPGFQSFELWSTNAQTTLPHEGAATGVPHYFPNIGDSVFRIISFPPQQNGQTLLDTSNEAINELKLKFPSLLDHLELDCPGMHTTDSVDYGLVLQGEITLELDRGEERRLKVGDCVVQNGTRHAWHNRSAQPAIVAFILLGVPRSTPTGSE